jgi:transcriptional regulator with GAF, ATPase, and Fis domain
VSGSQAGSRFELVEETAPAKSAGAEARDVPAEARTLAELERDHIAATLERLQWRIEGPGGAAAVLGINASTLRSRMRKHGIRRPGPGSGAARA